MLFKFILLCVLKTTPVLGYLGSVLNDILVSLLASGKIGTYPVYGECYSVVNTRLPFLCTAKTS